MRNVKIALAVVPAALVSLAAAFVAAGSAEAQSPPVGQLEVKAYQPLPRKTKIAVQLGSDTHLGREIRRMVMEKVAARGNEVGFSGGTVMRLDVTYIDLSSIGGGRGPDTLGGTRGFEQPGSNPRMELPSNRIERRDTLAPSSSSTLRIGLTLYMADGGKVIWAAVSSCQVQGNLAERAGEAMVDAIFSSPDKSRTGDASCPI